VGRRGWQAKRTPYTSSLFRVGTDWSPRTRQEPFRRAAGEVFGFSFFGFLISFF
jgi:hypothetical protein